MSYSDFPPPENNSVDQILHALREIVYDDPPDDEPVEEEPPLPSPSSPDHNSGNRLSDYHESAEELTAHSLNTCAKPLDLNSDITTMRRYLAHALEEDGDGQDMLRRQAQVLDMMFHRLLDRSLRGETPRSSEKNPHYVYREMLNMMFRTQSQARMSVETLSRLKLREQMTRRIVQTDVQTKGSEND